MTKKIVLNLEEHIRNVGFTQKEFSEYTGLRRATISNLSNNKYERIQLDHLLTIMEALDITDFNEILSIQDVDYSE